MKTNHRSRHSGLDPESMHFNSLLDAGSVMPDLIRYRHDEIKFMGLLWVKTCYLPTIHKLMSFSHQPK